MKPVKNKWIGWSPRLDHRYIAQVDIGLGVCWTMMGPYCADKLDTLAAWEGV